MMLVPADTFDVVPGRCLMTAITLVDLSRAAAFRHLRVFLFGDLLRDHFEVHHVVARRRLMALRA